MIEGITITFGEREFTVPPANMKTVKAWLKANTEIAPNTLEYFEAVTDFVFNTLRRNYPDLERDFVDEHLDGRNRNVVLKAIADSAGLVPGEAKTQETVPTSTGTTSTST
jgi:hypothetical protein